MKPFRRSYTAFLLVLTFGMAVACWSEWTPLRRLETVVFDRLSIMRTIPGGGSVVLVAIDDDSIRRKGGWPWSRGDLATVIDRLSAAGARAIGLEMLYPEKVADHPIDAVPGEDSGAPFCDPVPRGSSAGDQGIGLRNRRDGDHRLMAAVRSARNLVLPLRLIDAHSRPSDPRIDAFIRIHSLPLVDGTKKGMASVNRWAAGIDARWFAEVVPAAVVAPYPDLCGKAGGLGHVSGSTDADGLCRFDTLLIPFRDRLVPSFALQLAIKAMDGDIRRLSIHSPGPSARSLEIGTARIGSDRFFRFYIDGGQVIDRFEEVSFVDVQEGRLGDEMFRDRVVLIGPTSAMITELLPGPLGQRRSSVQYSAAAVDGLIRGVSIQRAPWAIAIELGALLYVGFFLWAVIPRVQKRIGGLILGAFLIVWTATVVTLFKVAGLWLFWFPPVILALSGGVLAVGRRRTIALYRKNAELIRTLAVVYQGQGQLELAAEQLLAGPVEDRSMKSAFYQLGMELERKRHYSRALELYEHLLRFGRYRDVRQRVRQLRSAGALVTSDGEPQSAGTLVLTGGPSRPTFGRYEVVSELGQGAMGTVFLGKDPKINREVAIKTLDYQSIPPGELGDMKARFFREAEAAGKLSHPSIVTVFDVGEEHDMAYMAMERLDGEELTVWCTGEKRQPVNRVVAVMLTVAEALDYAHREGVVHRDIKPANIMVLKAGGVKVADFGIARIMDHSKTKTGIVMGTPTYMSPEQIAGKRVDGRSDLFSLGVVFYELLTGKRPFSGDSMTALMYAISKSPHTPILQVRPDLPECCAAVVERLLRKGVTRRFKNAGVLADTLRICCNDLGD